MDKRANKTSDPFSRLNELTVSELIEAIKKNPQEAEQKGCPWERLLGNDWVELLITHPQFGKYCDGAKLSGANWAKLLIDQPQLAVGCPWEKFSLANWNYLLKERPEFNLFKQLRDLNCGLATLSAEDLAYILASKPQLATRCPAEKFKEINVAGWKRILRNSKIFEYLPEGVLASLTDHDVLLYFLSKKRGEKILQAGNKDAWLLCYSHRRSSHEYVEKCPFKDFTHSDWRRAIFYNLSLFDHPDFDPNCLEGADWVKIIARHPQLYKRCPLDKIPSEGLRYLLHWSNFGQWHEETDLDHQAFNFLIHCDWPYAFRFWHRSRRSNAPSMVARRKVLLTAITREDFPWDKLDVVDYQGLLARFRDLEAKLPWAKLPVNAWKFRKQLFTPSISSQCPWDRFTVDDWIDLIMIHCDEEVDWGVNGRGEVSNIISQIKNLCKWEKFDGSAWSCILSDFPEFADKCDWSKITDEEQILELLSKQPQFADKCDCSKLNDSCWDKLLKDHPELRKFKPQK